MVEQQGNPYQISMGFAQFFAGINDELTGSMSVIEERGSQKLPDGREIPNLVIVSQKDPYATPLCNDNGARRIIHAIRLIENPHNAFGNLNKDEIAIITGNTVRQAFTTVLANQKEYEITSTSKIEAEGLAIFDSLYIFLTGLKEAGYRGFVGEMYQIRFENKQQAMNEASGRLLS